MLRIAIDAMGRDHAPDAIIVGSLIAARRQQIGLLRVGASNVIEDTLARGEWERTRAHAAALESYTSAEPLPYTELLIARGRVFAALGATPQEAAARSELERLKADALRLKWPIGWQGN